MLPFAMLPRSGRPHAVLLPILPRKRQRSPEKIVLAPMAVARLRVTEPTLGHESAELARSHPSRLVGLAAARRAAGALASRQKKRARLVAAAEVPRQSSFLERASVTAATAGNYHRSYAKFVEFARFNGFAPSADQPLELDCALAPYMNSAYLEGEQPHVGSTLLAAVSYLMPELGRPRELDLPKSKQCLRGWRRMAPAAGRLPLPWELIAGMAMDLLARDQAAAAMALVVSVVFYLRPSELLGLRVRNLTPPLRGAGPTHKCWSLSLHEHLSEDSRPSKTGEFNEALSLDLARFAFVGRFLEQLMAGKQSSVRLVPLRPGQLAEVMAGYQERWGIPFEMRPYQLRHSGASIDYASGDRRIKDIKLRGRWKTDASVRRYERASQLTRQLHRVPPVVRTCCLKAASMLPGVAYGRCEPRAFRA